jgi:hypothetical protein
MTLIEYRETYSWQQAIELSPRLMALAEELPAAEAMGLSWQLRQTMVELPASIAGDLLRGTEDRINETLKLVTALELIDHVYPALDTADTRKSADELAARLMSENFAEHVGGVATSVAVLPATVPPATTNEPAATPVIPAEVPVVSEPSQEAVAAPTPMNVPITQEPDVHPDSV